MLWVLVLGAILVWAPPPTITHRTGVQRAHIKPKPCFVNGVEGTCMFVYECIKTDGKHVGMCVDNFMFGSCCSHNITHNAIMPPSQSHHNYHYHHNHQHSNSNLLHSSNNIYSSPRPPNHVFGGRPQSNKLRPSKPVGFVTHPTKKPSSATNHWFKEPTATSTTSHKQLPMAKPWTKPPSFVTSSVSFLKPYFPEIKLPALVSSDSYEVTQSLLIVPVNSSPASNNETSSTTPTTNASSSSSTYNLISTSKPSSFASSLATNSKNKTSYYTSSTLLMTMSTTTTKTTTIKTANYTTTSTTTTTTPRPIELMSSSSSWVTPKPSWLGSLHSNNNIWSSSKPLSQSFKPDYLLSEKPNFVTNQGSWSPTSEPSFVTRPRPSSNLWLRPKPTRKPISLLGLGMSSTRSNLTTFDSSNNSSSTTTTTTENTKTSVVVNGATSQMLSSNNLIKDEPKTTTAQTTTTSTPTLTSTEAATSTINYSKLSKYSGQCGVPTLSPRPEMRIVGGKNAPFGGWPWQVSVRRTSFFGFSSTHRCGGAVINENWIATAGHCVDDLLTSQIRIRVGEYDFSSVQEPYPFVERGVSKKVVHPKYNFFTYEYDLALVRLESSLEFQPHISPICLPASDDLLIGENATVTGWGRLSEGGTLPSVLQQVSVPIVSNDKCKSMFLRAGRHEFIPEIFLCAGYENGGQDSCQGDSGGPLQVKGKNGRYFLAGIISWGIGCAEANLPGVCTRISKFVPWILENVT